MHEATVNEVLSVVVTMSTTIGEAHLLVVIVLVAIVSVHLVEDLLWMITMIVLMEDVPHLETILRHLLGDTIRIHTMLEAHRHQQEVMILTLVTLTHMPDHVPHQEVLTEANTVGTTEDTEELG